MNASLTAIFPVSHGLAADLPAAHTGIQQSWMRFGAAFQDALLELYPEANADPVIALIWTQPSA